MSQEDNKDAQSTPPPPSLGNETHERFGLPPLKRIGLGAGLAYGSGMFLGVAQGAQTAGLRFRAENAHRLPTNQRGWYLYHQAKNATALKGAWKEGNRFGARLAPWSIMFFGVEEAIDTLRLRDYGDDSRKDFLSTTVAGLAVAGGFSTWNRLPMITAARMAKIGLLSGLGFGVLQDILHLLHGQRLAYVDLVGRIFRRAPRATREEIDTT